MTDHKEKDIPQEIEHAFYQDGIAEKTQLSGGSVNTTLQVTDMSNQKSILQRLSPMFGEIMADDFDIVSGHLQNEGWEVASPIKSVSGDSYVTDLNGNLWRSFSFIESDGNIAITNPESSIALGGLLGRLHNSLSRLEYTPIFSLPHFHETAYYTDKLENLLPELPSHEIRTLGVQTIKLAKEHSISQDLAQLIHGDPKANNALYRNGIPFTFIDFDTLMVANPLIDVGDMLRSLTSRLLVKHPDDLTLSKIEPVIEASYEQAKPQINEKEFLRQALNAGQVIALELGIRSLIDSIEGTYFDWDKELFDSRSSHNIARAQMQWQVYQALL